MRSIMDRHVFAKSLVVFTSRPLSWLIVCFDDISFEMEMIVELRDAGLTVRHKDYFDTLKVSVSSVEEVKKRAEAKKINLRFDSGKCIIKLTCRYYEDGDVGVSLDETTKTNDLVDLLEVFGVKVTKSAVSDLNENRLMISF